MRTASILEVAFSALLLVPIASATGIEAVGDVEVRVSAPEEAQDAYHEAARSADEAIRSAVPRETSSFCLQDCYSNLGASISIRDGEVYFYSTLKSISIRDGALYLDEKRIVDFQRPEKPILTQSTEEANPRPSTLVNDVPPTLSPPVLEDALESSTPPDAKGGPIDDADQGQMGGGVETQVRANPSLAATDPTGWFAAVLIVAAGFALAPLFHRFRSSREILAHGTRARVYEILARAQGATGAELARILQCDKTTIAHHLRTLERAGLVVAQRAGNRTVYFQNGTGAPVDHVASAYLRDPLVERVVGEITRNPHVSLRALARATGLGPSSAHWHILRLERAGLLHVERTAGKGTRYEWIG